MCQRVRVVKGFINLSIIVNLRYDSFILTIDNSNKFMDR